MVRERFACLQLLLRRGCGEDCGSCARERNAAK
jgi:hypothetical protein